MRRITIGLLATITLILLVFGLPALLVAIWPVGLPHVEASPAGVWAALLRPDDGTLFLTLMKAAGWIIWVLILLAIGAEVVARVHHLQPPTLPGLTLPQGLARGLVAASLALFVNTNAAVGQAPNTAAQAAPIAVPAAAPESPQDAHDDSKPRYQRYIVKKGDILSQIALDHLGDAHRYPEIFKASRGIPQPGGARLTDPDVIDIGWKLNIPVRSAKSDDEPAKSHEPKRSEPETNAATVPPQVPDRTTDVESVPPAPSKVPEQASGNSAPAAQHADEAEVENARPPWLLTGLAGAGAILAGSLWLVLRRRRAVQHHHRRPGFVTAPPPPHALPVEKTLRHQGQPVSDLLNFIDDNLRRLAAELIARGEPLPELLAIAATPTSLRVHLAKDAALPDPWQPSESASVWSLEVADDPGGLDPLEPDGPAPWPHLATIGADNTGRWWLLNLEVSGITVIDGEPDYASDLARYLAAELATSPWSRDIQVDLIGVFDELAELDPRRLRHHANADGIDDTISAAVETIDRLNHLRLSELPAARAQQAGDEIWLNRVLITANPAGHLDELVQLVRDQPGRTGVAALIIGSRHGEGPAVTITVGADGWAHVPALGLNLIANGITRDEARGCVQLIQAADQLTSTDVPATEGEGWRQYADLAGRLRADLTEPRNPDGAAGPDANNLPQPDAEILKIAATTAEDLAVLAPEVPRAASQLIEDADQSLDADFDDWFSDNCQRPRLAVLGVVKVRVGPGGQPAEAAKRRPYYTELVAYLATQPNGATTDQLCSAFATTPARIHRDLGVVRKWLGVDPATGELHLPEAFRPSATPTGRGVYRLHGVLSDADLFRRLRLRGQARGVDGLEDLLRALRLVSGAPYTQLRPGGGIWLAEDRDDQHLLVGIIDTAHLTVTMTLQAGDVDSARRAASLAATVAPHEQIHKLDLAAIAEADGDPGQSARLAAESLRQRDPDGPIEPDPRSSSLANSRGWTRLMARTG
ncbi:MAG: hypothetical protein KJ817_11975 [Actinobacteria bacterium]|nr:hypothetical protein [Actinomycetota bacterium]